MKPEKQTPPLSPKYPNVPTYALPKPKKRNASTNGLTSAIINFIRLMSGYAVRVNTQGQYHADTGKWTKGQTTKGTSDIHACFAGRHLSIEIKTGRDVLSDAQKETQRKVEEAGGIYLVASDFDSFLTWWKQTFKDSSPT